jgi:chitodextrinase
MNASANCTVNESYNNVKLWEQTFPTPTYSSPFWESTKVYNQGQIVRHHDGHQYEARWWNQGNEPGSASGEVWKMTIGSDGKPQTWESNQVYYAGEQTAYKDRRYTAKWWTKGDTPGATTAWTAGEILDPLALVKLSGNYKRETCKISSQPDVYDTVITTNWAITEGHSTIAYWKIMREDYVRPMEMWQETQRGTTKSGTVVFRKGNTIWQEDVVHLCTSANKCRRVIPVN